MNYWLKKHVSRCSTFFNLGACDSKQTSMIVKYVLLEIVYMMRSTELLNYFLSYVNHKSSKSYEHPCITQQTFIIAVEYSWHHNILKKKKVLSSHLHLPRTRAKGCALVIV